MSDRERWPPYMTTVDRATRAAVAVIPFLLALAAFASTSVLPSTHLGCEGGSTVLVSLPSADTL